jgi:hypothetical protein
VEFVGPCIFTGKLQKVAVRPHQLLLYHAGALLQDAFSHLDAGQREWLKTGISDEGWATTDQT